MKSRFIILFIFLFATSTLFSQKIKLQYIGIGYNLSYAPLSRVNEFIDLYNASKTKINGAVIETEMNHIKGLTGIHFTTGFKYDEIIFDICWTKRSSEVFANYESPFHDERHIKYRTSTLSFGALAPLKKFDKLSIYAGFSADFVAGRLQTYILSDSPTRTFKDLNSFGNFGFEPVLQLYYHPFEGIPFELGCRIYWQANLFKNDMAGLESEMYNHWKSDITDLKSGGSNLGVVFQALIIIPNFKIKMPEKKEKLVEEQKPSVPQKITFIASVLDSTTNKPISAILTIANKYDVKSEVATTSGFINTSLFNNDVYTITVESFGYQPKTFTIKLENYPLDRITRNYALSMIKVGASVTLNNIYFEKASAVLLPESMTELEKIFQFMNSNPKVAIELSGHTSSEGKDDYNMQLSSDRANAIKRWLTEKGIAENRINAIGYGKTKPVADNSTEDGRKKNRRVELKVIKN